MHCIYAEIHHIWETWSSLFLKQTFWNPAGRLLKGNCGLYAGLDNPQYLEAALGRNQQSVWIWAVKQTFSSSEIKGLLWLRRQRGCPLSGISVARSATPTVCMSKFSWVKYWTPNCYTRHRHGGLRRYVNGCLSLWADDSWQSLPTVCEWLEKHFLPLNNRNFLKRDMFQVETCPFSSSRWILHYLPWSFCIEALIMSHLKNYSCCNAIILIICVFWLDKRPMSSLFLSFFFFFFLQWKPHA